MLAWGETTQDSRIGITKYNWRDLRTSLVLDGSGHVARLKVADVMHYWMHHIQNSYETHFVEFS